MAPFPFPLNTGTITSLVPTSTGDIIPRTILCTPSPTTGTVTSSTNSVVTCTVSNIVASHEDLRTETWDAVAGQGQREGTFVTVTMTPTSAPPSPFETDSYVVETLAMPTASLRPIRRETKEPFDTPSQDGLVTIPPEILDHVQHLTSDEISSLPILERKDFTLSPTSALLYLGLPIQIHPLPLSPSGDKDEDKGIHPRSPSSEADASKRDRKNLAVGGGLVSIFLGIAGVGVVVYCALSRFERQARRERRGCYGWRVVRLPKEIVNWCVARTHNPPRTSSVPLGPIGHPYRPERTDAQGPAEFLRSSILPIATISTSSEGTKSGSKAWSEGVREPEEAYMKPQSAWSPL